MTGLRVVVMTVIGVLAGQYLGAGLFDYDQHDIITMTCSAAHLPAIIFSDSTNENRIFVTSLIAAGATGIKLVQELFYKPQATVGQVLLSNIPTVFLCISNIALDAARALNASKVAAKNELLPPSGYVKFNQLCFFTVEMLLRLCLWSSKDPTKQDNKKLLALLGVGANFIEQLRLNARWMNQHTGLPHINVDFIDASDNAVSP